MLEGSESIVAFAGRLRFWRFAERRMGEFASRLREHWVDRLAICDAAELAAAVKRSMMAIIELDEDDWLVSLHVSIGLPTIQGTGCTCASSPFGVLTPNGLSCIGLL